MGYAVDYYAGNKLELAVRLETCITEAEAMNLWVNGEPFNKTLTEVVAYLKRIHSDEHAGDEDQQKPGVSLTIEEAKKKYACSSCEAATADECICDDLNFDEYCEHCGRQTCACKG